MCFSLTLVLEPDWVDAHRFDGDLVSESYLKKMEFDFEWATELELLAAEELFGLPVSLFSFSCCN